MERELLDESILQNDYRRFENCFNDMAAVMISEMSRLCILSHIRGIHLVLFFNESLMRNQLIYNSKHLAI